MSGLQCLNLSMNHASLHLPEHGFAFFGYASEVLQKLIRHKSGQTNLGHDVPVVQMRSLTGEWRNEHDPEEG
jgi:hypothetical protein